MSRSDDAYWERMEPLRRTGMDPDPWGRNWEDLYGYDLHELRQVRLGILDNTPLHPSVADRSWGEGADDEDGEA